MKRAMTFPGQGSQVVGMGKAIAEASAAAREVFEEVDEALQQSLSKLMWEGPAETLTLTENAQPALMAVSLALVATLEKEAGFAIEDKITVVAGHSLGEYSALCAAGSIGLAETARLLKTRGQAMQAAVPVGEGAMAAMLGLDIADVETVIETVSADGVCSAANDNAPGQVVISGASASVDRAIELAKEAGAKKAIRLAVSAPFHCPLMQPAAEAMAEALAGVSLEPPRVPLIANVTAAPVTDPDEIRRLLVDQVTARVRWRETIASLASHGIEGVVEVGAGKVLTGMAKRIDRSLSLATIETPDDIDTFLKSL
ncbi:MAG: ACP S-malonyltransferase [Pseudomonadota bacterium]